MKMTRKEALELSVDMWEFLAEDPDHEKEQHPKWEEIYRFFPAGCALCWIYYGSLCNLCPLGEVGQECGIVFSLFNIWEDTEGAQRQGAAKDLLAIMKDALAHE